MLLCILCFSCVFCVWRGVGGVSADIFKSLSSNLLRNPQAALRRIYMTFILGTALQNFGTRANSFGHGPLDLHGKNMFEFFQC